MSSKDLLADPGVVAESNRLKNLFDKLDLNKDGRIDSEELAAGLHNMGYFHISKEQIEMFLQRSDSSKSGDLSLQEFVEYLQKHEKQLHFVFSKLDTNKDGRVNSAEIKVAFKNLGISIGVEEAEKLVSRIDDDNSLDISFEEWRDYLMFHPSSNIDDIIEYWRQESYLTQMDHGEDVGTPGDISDRLFAGIWWRHLLAGGVAGAVSRTCTAPLDRLKVMKQVHGGRKQTSLKDTFKYMLKEGGIKGLWRGNGINVIKIAPESALKFWAYDEMKKHIKGTDNRDLFIHERLMAGSFAGALSQTVIYPLEVMKTRLALRKTGEFKSIFDCATKIFKADGFKVFYKGYWPNLFGIIPYAGIDLAVYETLKAYCVEKYVEENRSPNALVLLSCGTFSSCCGQLAAYPLALVRTKLQSQAGLAGKLGLPAEQTHTLGLFRYIVRTEGLKGLYRGIVPNFCKVAPAVSISYYVYERTRSRLGVEMCS
eukprot:GFUD01041837.1.p1 GENE.GFUD01041837.1~~GFUD01041837.1.p1  ORF type:complete len:482 (+),score=108.77 GFUD01041837.1:170-1615(+)